MQTDPDVFSALILRAQSGDTQAEQRLLEDNLPLVYAISKRYMNRGLEPEDLRQLGSIGLLKAIRKQLRKGDGDSVHIVIRERE